MDPSRERLGILSRRSRRRRAARAARRWRRRLARAVRDAPDRQVERRFGHRLPQRLLLRGVGGYLERRLPAALDGDVRLELTRPASGRAPRCWTLRAGDRKVQAIHGTADRPPALIVRMPVADFVRIVAGVADPAVVMLQGRIDVEGDLGLMSLFQRGRGG